uniref:Uncharacterized protein n=1 Tax=Timema douglasi TaxID=61478 RepID=A0A7R8VPA1_TIMDO|nr:unnamed protein product [Timema douglasi]
MHGVLDCGHTPHLICLHDTLLAEHWMGNIFSAIPDWMISQQGLSTVVGFVAGAFICGGGHYLYWCRALEVASARHMVVVTGCDSGLGFSVALHLHSLGLTVVAACLDAHGSGATKLKALAGLNRMHVLRLDIRDGASIEKAVREVHLLLQRNRELQLRALVNNAGVMVFGEFEWLTERLINQQVEVNLLGTMRITKAFCSLIRHHEGRIVTVTSHCASQALPGLSVYGATKAALKAWSDALRVEQAKYGVKVITLVPGSFVMQSNILAHHDQHTKEMDDSMTPTDKLFFGDYFQRFNSYLSGLSEVREPTLIDDSTLLKKFEHAILAHRPYAHYQHAPYRYVFYHFLLNTMPVWIRDKLVVRFVAMPGWQDGKASS